MWFGARFMKTPLKALVIVAVVSNVAIVGLIAFRHKGTRHATVKSELTKSAPQLADRIEQVVATLAKESVGDSLNKLVDVNLFYWPGPLPSTAYSGGLVVEYLPLDKKFGQTDVEAILSNRRFLKIMEDLNKMDRTAVSELVNTELARASEVYNELFIAEMQRFAPHYQVEKLAGKASITGPTFVTGNVEEGKVVIAGARLKVLALVFICGELGLTDCKSTVENVVKIALKQRTELYEASTLSPFFRAEMLKRASVYNRQILSSALLGLEKNDAQTAIMKELELQWRERKVPTYKTALTEFDLPVRSGAAKPDYSLGSRSIKLTAPVDDSRFDQLLRKVGISL